MPKPTKRSAMCQIKEVRRLRFEADRRRHRRLQGRGEQLRTAGRAEEPERRGRTVPSQDVTREMDADPAQRSGRWPNVIERRNKPSQRRPGGTPGHVRAEWPITIAGIRTISRPNAG